ncbi:2,3-bisphosphoglycerate-independent phosphoglycerate mutase [Azospirillum brasilense]|uniref:2,3-bisphosphoglycerate-independent phosphoglycerate mutase n=1 Tax=Azospirillum brasilense TaxID=192 RepID=A0A0P0F7T3_AZOBR|nr:MULTISPECIES: 2,3-bisphosphoglycerate-independent phosphoglycerate mutase [Azospirillum]ALJ36031.1 2,3-bisphosphoglycerate-independent phosphoglycerate mutase [Azospirillum brasilense]MDW7552448.1 2,3-bisphosphoglycerate-independent phosphoglycerate mutase [Azospirillum brasilense]MDW7592362.1 2,3-bisphosphoglycerate-independent phosphoglycerate mutase [Azospirillum brasilense]MDW7627492.1 2,3-bisphosphoglycerate-independent phosphoglycerate mutase [Azospirillum brasilense]MDW7628943.1 2,3-
MTETNRPRPVVLCILDGWGYREEREDNAIAQGNTPNWDRLWSSEPRAFLEASEEEVGLPKGQMGNSEVGHMNLGAGRVVRQDLVMIDHAIVEGELERNAALNDLAKTLLASGGRCHILGLLSPGGVHSHQDHIAALAGVLAHEGVPVEIHAFTDGRDVPPQSAKDQMAEFMADVHTLPGVNVATVSGRYYAMDRDKRWDRVAKAYATLVSAQGETAADPIQAIEQSYAAGTHDEFILPTVIDGYTGMKDGDAILMANFRADRAREILAAFVDPAFDGFERASVPKLAAAVGMVEYSSTLAKLMTTIFPPKSLTKVLGEVVSEAGLTQLRIAETEKYPHVTFFFNGGEERVYPGEDRILVPSPKVATYDLQPEMSAAEVTDKVVAAVDSGKYDLVVINYANPDMVGHSGILSAAIKAVEAVDASLGRLEAAVRAQGGVMLVTADHGNCELMKDPQTNGPHTAHTLDKVPLVLVNGPAGVSAIRSGRLADIAPTLLDLMKLPQPAEMTGKSLIDRASARAAAE